MLFKQVLLNMMEILVIFYLIFSSLIVILPLLGCRWQGNYIYIYIYIYILKWVGPQRDLYFLGFIYLFFSYIRVYFHLHAFVKEHVWHKALLMEYSVRIELTRVCSLSCFQLVMGFFMKDPSFFFLEFVSLNLFLPFICFWYWIRCVCVCRSLNKENFA